jgi:ribonuclease T1
MGVAAVAAAAMVLAPGEALAKRESPSTCAEARNGAQVVALANLPRQAQDTHRLIRSGGPFPFDKDGTVFGNREHALPSKPRGHYREYTVKTPGERDRGARRIVCGGQTPSAPEACYYTDDHYASFRRIVE